MTRAAPRYSSEKARDEIAFASIGALIRRFEARDLSPVDAVDAAFDRIETYDPQLNAFCALDMERARDAARRSEERWRRSQPLGPLDGIPISVKDNLLVAGLPCRRGSRTTSAEPVGEDAPVVARLREAGAIILGKTNLPEFGLGPVTISPLTGITRNPWNTAKTAGGSSGGAAAAVACGLGQAAIGTDAGGSIRIPAALCGVVGFKPTGMLLANYPASAAGAIASPGPIARNVEDAARLLSAMAGPDSRDPDTLSRHGQDFLKGLADGLSGVRIAVSDDLGFAQRVPAEIRDRLSAAAATFRALGAEVEESHPAFDPPLAVYLGLFQSGLAYALRNLPEERQGELDETVRDALRAGRQVGLFDYLRLQEARRDFSAAMARFHERYDLLVTPTVSVTAFQAEARRPQGFEDLDDRAWTPFCYPFNLSQQPAVTVPCGVGGDGLPIGLQIVGARFSDTVVLRAAFAFEAGFTAMPPLPNSPRSET